MAHSLGSAIRDEVLALLAPLAGAAAVPAGAQPAGATALLRGIGHVGALAHDPGLDGEVRRVAALAEDIATLTDDDLASWQGIIRVLGMARDVTGTVRALESALADPSLAARAQDLGTEFVEWLFALYLRRHHPALFRTAATLTLITPAEHSLPEPAIVDNGAVTRLSRVRDRFHFDRISSLFSDTLGVLGAEYLPGGMSHAADAHTAATRLFPLLRELARTGGLAWRANVVRVVPEPEPSLPAEDDVEPIDPPLPTEDDSSDERVPAPPDASVFHSEHRPQFAVYLPEASADGGPDARFGLTLTASSAEHPDGVRGFVVAPAGEVGWSETRNGWRVALEAGGAIPAFVLGPDGVNLAPLATPLTGGTASFVVERIAAPGEPAFRLGGDRETRIELGALRLRVDLVLSAVRQAIAVSVEADSGKLVLAPGSGDGFLRAVLPGEGAKVPFDFGLVLSSDRGLEIKGGVGLELVLTPNLKAGPVRVPTVRVALESEGGDLRLAATGAVAVKLGPATIVVEGIGAHLTAAQSPSGSFGPLDLDAGLRAPSGAGISIDAPIVTGGGFLAHDAAKSQYAGVVQLQLEKLALSAIGLLTTRLPDGEPGFSLLAIVNGERFPPIDLGMGFRLTGVGGLLGLNRSVAVDVLRSGLKTGALDALLFPKDPVRNATAIVSGAGRVFPVTAGQHVVGPVAEITWGTSGLLTAQVGLVLEFPSPLRLVLVGQMRALFPSKQKALVRLNLDLLGTVDFDRGEALVLATLFDSKLLEWNVSGDAAFYARWKENPEFILSVGGFHPAYPAPGQLPALDRLSMVLSEGDNFRLRMAWYLALTANTLQYGSRTELHISAIGFSVDGHVGFDALVQLDPFGFTVSFTSGVALKWHGHSLASVQLDGTLAGPSPWHVRGKATFRIWRFGKSVSFDRTLGREESLPPAPIVDPLPALVAALAEPSSWEAALPSREEMLVTLRDARVPGTVVVHPLGSVSVRQQVLPLNIEIARFGHSRVAQTRTFRIADVEFDGESAANVTPLFDHFAAGQFQELSQGERLSRPSFEPMQSGVRVEPEALTYGGKEAARARHRRDTLLEYETVVLTQAAVTGETIRATLAAPYRPAVDRARQQAEFGAAARAATRRTGARRFAVTRAAHVQVQVQPIRESEVVPA